MIARWMLASIAFGALVAVAALAIEHALRATRRPLRAPWTVALIVGTLWPLIAPLVLTARSATIDTSAPLIATSTSTFVIGAADVAGVTWMERLDPVLSGAWAIATALLLLQVVFAVRTLRRVQRRATATTLDGESVLVDRELGPAVVGLSRPRIVVPEWLLELDAPLRTLVLKHEREHCQAGDPRLVWLSAIATTIVPWNPALWWMARRLRAAMEIDCDTRTLRGDVDATRYASLLLLIAQRHASARFVPLLSPAASQLTRRIASMRASIPKFRVARVLLAMVGAATAIAAACSPRVATNLTSPTPVAEPEAAPQRAEPVVVTAPPLDTTSDHSATLVSATQRPKYPESMRAANVGAAIKVQFIVDADGRVDTNTIKFVDVQLSDGAPAEAKGLFVSAVKSALNDVRYSPARVRGRDVRQLVTLPLVFSTTRSSTPRAAAAARPATVGIDPVTGAQQPYFDFQVERPAEPVAGTKGPQYPQLLRDAKVEGNVLVQFVVDTLGVPDMRSFRVLKSDHDGFSEAVREAVTNMKFAPARVGGRGVKQLVQTPFQFSLSR